MAKGRKEQPEKTAAQKLADKKIKQREATSGCQGAACLAGEIQKAAKDNPDYIKSLQGSGAGSVGGNTLAVLEMTKIASGEVKVGDTGAKNAVDYCSSHGGKDCGSPAGMQAFMQTQNSDMAKQYEPIVKSTPAPTAVPTGPTPTVKYGTDACTGSDTSDEGYRACLKNPPISTTTTVNPDGTTTTVVVGYTMVNGARTSDVYTLSTITSKDHRVIQSVMNGKDITNGTPQDITVPQAPKGQAAPTKATTPAPLPMPTEPPGSRSCAGGFKGVSVPSGVTAEGGPTGRATCHDGKWVTCTDCKFSPGYVPEWAQQPGSSYQKELAVAESVTAGAAQSTLDAMTKKFNDCIGGGGTVSSCEMQAQALATSQPQEVQSQALTAFAQQVTQLVTDIRAELPKREASNTKYYQAYQKYIKDHPGTSFDDFDKLNQKAFDQMASTIAIDGNLEKAQAAFLRGDYVPLDEQAAYNKLPVTTRMGFWFGRLVEPIKNSAVGQSNTVVENRVTGIYASLDDTQKTQYQKDISQTGMYKDWLKEPGNAAKGPEDFIKYQLTAAVKNENSLQTTGNLRTDNTTQFYDQVMRGQFNAAAGASAIAANKGAVGFYNIMNVIVPTFTGGKNASRVYVQDQNVALETAQTVAAAQITVRDITNNNPTLAGELKLSDAATQKKVVDNYAASLFLEDHAKNGDLAGTNQLFEFDADWLKTGALTGSIDVAGLKEQVQKGLISNAPTTIAGGNPQSVAYGSHDAQVKAGELVVDAYLKSIDPDVTAALDSEMEKNIPSLAPAQRAQYRKDQLMAMVNNNNNDSNDLGLLYQTGASKPTIDQILTGERSYTRDLQAVTDAKKQTWAGLPAGKMAFALNRFENGMLGKGQLIRNAAAASWNEAGCKAAWDSVSCRQATWDGWRGGVMQTAKPAITVVALAMPALSFAHAGVAAVTMPAMVNVGSTYLGMQFTADGLAETMNNCSFREDMDAKACYTSAGMTAFAFASTVPGLFELGMLPKTAAVARASGELTALAGLNADKSILESATRTLELRTAEAAAAQSTRFATIINNPWTQRGTSALGAAVFGSQAVDSCKQGVSANCVVTAGFAIVSGGRVLVNPAIASDLTSSAGRFIHTVDQVANTAFVAESCLGQGVSAEKCGQALFMASLAFKTPAEQKSGTTRQGIEDIIGDIQFVKNAPDGSMVELSGGGQYLIRNNADRVSVIKQLTASLSQTAMTQGLIDLKVREALVKPKGAPETMLPGDRFLADAQKAYEKAQNGTAAQKDAAEQMLLQAKDMADAEKSLLSSPRNLFQRIADSVAPSKAVADYWAARDAFTNTLRGKNITNRSYAKNYEALTKAWTALNRQSMNPLQREYAGQYDAAQQSLAELTAQAQPIKEQLDRATSRTRKATLQKQLDELTAQIRNKSKQLDVLGFEQVAAGGLRNRIDLALGREAAVKERIAAQVAERLNVAAPVKVVAPPTKSLLERVRDTFKNIFPPKPEQPAPEQVVTNVKKQNTKSVADEVIAEAKNRKLTADQLFDAAVRRVAAQEGYSVKNLMDAKFQNLPQVVQDAIIAQAGKVRDIAYPAYRKYLAQQQQVTPAEQKQKVTKKEFIVGRGSDKNVDVPLTGLVMFSRQHFSIRQAETGGDVAYIKDLGSKVGTFVRGVEVKDTPVKIKAGDIIKLGPEEGWAALRFEGFARDGSPRFTLVGGVADINTFIKPRVPTKSEIANKDALVAQARQQEINALNKVVKQQLDERRISDSVRQKAEDEYNGLVGFLKRYQGKADWKGQLQRDAPDVLDMLGALKVRGVSWADLRVLTPEALDNPAMKPLAVGGLARIFNAMDKIPPGTDRYVKQYEKQVVKYDDQFKITNYHDVSYDRLNAASDQTMMFIAPGAGGVFLPKYERILLGIRDNENPRIQAQINLHEKVHEGQNLFRGKNDYWEAGAMYVEWKVTGSHGYRALNLGNKFAWLESVVGQDVVWRWARTGDISEMRRVFRDKGWGNPEDALVKAGIPTDKEVYAKYYGEKNQGKTVDALAAPTTLKEVTDQVRLKSLSTDDQYQSAYDVINDLVSNRGAYAKSDQNAMKNTLGSLLTQWVTTKIKAASDDVFTRAKSGEAIDTKGEAEGLFDDPAFHENVSKKSADAIQSYAAQQLRVAYHRGQAASGNALGLAQLALDGTYYWAHPVIPKPEIVLP